MGTADQRRDGGRAQWEAGASSSIQAMPVCTSQIDHKVMTSTHLQYWRGHLEISELVVSPPVLFRLCQSLFLLEPKACYTDQAYLDLLALFPLF